MRRLSEIATRDRHFWLPAIVRTFCRRPTHRGRSPWLRQHHGVVNGHLVDEGVLRGAAEMLGHALLVAVSPGVGTECAYGDIPHARVNPDSVHHQRISVPTTK